MQLYIISKQVIIKLISAESPPCGDVMTVKYKTQCR